MKKLFSLSVAFLMLLATLSLAGCGESKNKTESGETLKLGLGVHSIVGTVTDADAEKEGEGKITTTVAAVLLDKGGKIVDCAVDTAENTAKFDNEGKLGALGELNTKYEFGDSYGMKTYSAVGKEWYEQADGFAAAVKGKTLSEVKELSTGDDTLTAVGCTIDVSDFVIALEKAVNNASDSAATAEDTLNLGIAMSASSDDATEEVDGKLQIETSVTVAALGSDGKITAAATDMVDPAVSFDSKGACTSSFGTAVATKKEQGDDYGMKVASPIGKEWYEQANAFAGELVGKNAEEIGKLANSSGEAGEDLQTAGCTVNVSNMLKSAVKAATVK